MHTTAALFAFLSITGTATAAEPVSKATLGSQPATVEKNFGKPLKDLGPLKFYIACEGSENGAKWGFTFFGDKVTSMQRSACKGEQLDNAKVLKEATLAMPSDARQARDFRTSDGREAHEYRSASLAKAFPPAAFMSCDAEGHTKVVTAGTLSYAMAADGRSWILILGNCF